MKRKMGRLKESIVGQMAVKIMPRPAKNSPPRTANGTTSRAVGSRTPKQAMTPKHERDRSDRLGPRPEDLAGNRVLEREGRGHDRVERLLVVLRMNDA